MDIKLSQLAMQLRKKLPRFILVSGDEAVLMQDAMQSIHQVAGQQQFNQRQLYDTEDQFSWSELPALLLQDDLFSEKCILEIMNLRGKFDKQATGILESCIKQIPAHKMLVIRSAKLSPAQVKSKWYRHITQLGISVRIWPLTAAQSLAWMRQKLTNHPLQGKPKLLQYIIQQTQNNLTDIMQLIEKIRLCPTPKTIDYDWIKQLLTCHLALNVFNLSDAVLNGDIQQVIAYSQQVATQDSKQLILIVWAIAQMLERLHQLQQGKLGYTPASTQRALQHAARYFNQTQLQSYRVQLAQLDPILKGAQLSSHRPTLEQCWQQLYGLLIAIASRTQPSGR